MRLGPETKPSSGLFEGWVEEVDSGEELRFHSADELLRFLGHRFSGLSDAGKGADNKVLSDDLPTEADA